MVLAGDQLATRLTRRGQRDQKRGQKRVRGCKLDATLGLCSISSLRRLYLQQAFPAPTIIYPAIRNQELK